MVGDSDEALKRVAAVNKFKPMYEEIKKNCEEAHAERRNMAPKDNPPPLHETSGEFESHSEHKGKRVDNRLTFRPEFDK